MPNPFLRNRLHHATLATHACYSKHFPKKSTHFQVKSTVTEVLKVNTATVIIVNVSMDMDLQATDIVTDIIELKCDPRWVI